MNTKRRYFHNLIALLAVLLLISANIMLMLTMQLLDQTMNALRFPETNTPEPTPTEALPSDNSNDIASFAQAHNLTLSDWPDSLIALLDKNPEAADFVLNYPLLKDSKPEIDLGVYLSCNEVPLFLQWDARWGYSEYGNELMGLSGCGPTCLSMVCFYLLKDPQFTPRYVADFAQQHGYCLPGNGSSWTLISEGGKMLGLDVIEIPLDKNRITGNLEAGNPIICVMGPGDFTTTGHFIVMTDYVDGKIKINDPNSPSRSNKLWDYDLIKDQIRNLWVCC